MRRPTLLPRSPLLAVALLAAVAAADGVCSPETPPASCPADIPPQCWDAAACTCGRFARWNEATCGGNPCSGVTCSAPGTVCVPSYCNGCNHMCRPGTPAPPTPAPPPCTVYRVPETCTAGVPPHCWAQSVCRCGAYQKKTEAQCGGNPCDGVVCNSGYECVPNYCAGCYYRCAVATPQPPAPTTLSPPQPPVGTSSPHAPPGSTAVPPVGTAAPPLGTAAPQAPAPSKKCDPYTPGPTAPCPSGLCYSAAACSCIDPAVGEATVCKTNFCSLPGICHEGYYCKDSLGCGECWYQCVRIVPGECTPYKPVPSRGCRFDECYSSATCRCREVQISSCTGSRDPCAEQPCAVGFRCEPNPCGGCHYNCVDVTPPVCSPYVPQLEECHGAGECYNFGHCQCGEFSRPSYCEDARYNPCVLNNPCNNDFWCKVDNCGGCHASCRPKGPSCAPTNPVRSCGSGRCYRPDFCVCGDTHTLEFEYEAHCNYPHRNPCLNDNNPCDTDTHWCKLHTCGACTGSCHPKGANCVPTRSPLNCPSGQCYRPDWCVCGDVNTVEFERLYCDWPHKNPCVNGNNPCDPATHWCKVNSCGECLPTCHAKGPSCAPTSPVLTCPEGQCYRPDWCVCGDVNTVEFKETVLNCELTQNNPCWRDANPCNTDTHWCKIHTCGGCRASCHPKGAACTPYKEAPECDDGECYRPDICVCGQTNTIEFRRETSCTRYPLRLNPCLNGEFECASDHWCKLSDCGGCHASCHPKGPSCTIYQEHNAICSNSPSGQERCYNTDFCVCGPTNTPEFQRTHCPSDRNPCVNGNNPCPTETHWCKVNNCGGCLATCRAKGQDCTPYRAHLVCPAGQCYHTEWCVCGSTDDVEFTEHSNCDVHGVNPCDSSPCSAGHTCRISTCGGCHAYCEPDASVKPTPPPPTKWGGDQRNADI
eukprot:Rhum_TRINITY_DN4451_c0_g1::Rhum_TRINITY_DN4451_c0_g1_i1::g.14451::m.14451